MSSDGTACGDLAKYEGAVVQWEGDTKRQKTSWFVGSDLTRRHIPSSSVFNCLRSLGAPEPVALPSTTLDALTDQAGVQMTCPRPKKSSKTGRLLTGQGLVRGQRLTNGLVRLEFGQDGNASIVGPCDRVLWSSGPTGAHYLVNQEDGNLVAYLLSGRAVWSTGSGGGRNKVLLGTDGNLVVQNGAGGVAWQSDSAYPAKQPDRLTLCERLNRGQARTTADRKFRFGLRRDGAFFLEQIGVGEVWSTGPTAMRSLMLRGDGVLAGLDTKGAVVQTFPPAGTASSADIVTVQAGGNLVLVSSRGGIVWETGPKAVVPLDAAALDGSIIRRDDGVSWVVLGGTRRHIPDYATDLCAQYAERRTVSRTGLSSLLAGTIPESSTKYRCNLAGRILRSSDKPDPKPSYLYRDGKRFWLPDGWTYEFFVLQGIPVVDLPFAAIQLLPDGGTEPNRLNPNSVTPNTIIRRSDGVSWVVDGDRRRHHIPFVQDDVCWRFLKGLSVSATGLTASQADSLLEAEAWPCIIGNRIVKSSDSASYLVDTTNTRHLIPDAETLTVLTRTYPVVGPWPANEVAKVPLGAQHVYLLDAGPLRNTIICRSDNVCWAVDNNSVRHHIPTHSDNVCWRWVNGWRVSRSGLNIQQAASLGEADAWKCSMNGRVLNTGAASYYMDGATRRWIQDPESYYCYTGRGAPVTSGISMDEVRPIPEGSAMPRCLNPGRVTNSIICRSDGVCWAVDGNGVRHHIPTYADNVCWRWVNGWQVRLSGLSAEQAGSIGEGGAWGCNLGGRIIATNEGHSYYMDGNTRRWIADTETFYCYSGRGAPIIRGMGLSEARGIPEGSAIPRCLDPGRVKRKIVRVNDGTAYFVDNSGYWHWIPRPDLVGGVNVWNCLTARYSVLIWDATWDQVNTLRIGRDTTWANCSM